MNSICDINQIDTGMKKSFISNIKAIKKAMESRKLVIFAGAGLSADAGVPLWSEFIDALKSEMDLPEKENDFLKISQMYYNERLHKEYVEKLREVLKHKKLHHNDLHEQVFKLDPEHVLTTNFDDLLEQVIEKKAHPYSVVKKDKELPYANTRLLVKIHGDLSYGDFVFKEDDYLCYSDNYPLIEGFIKSVFAHKTVLFVGYSFNDVNLKLILQSVRNILGSDFQNAYLINVDDDIHEANREYFKNKGIKVLHYDDANENAEKSFIEDYLNGNNAIGERLFSIKNTLKEKGQKLFNFLKFIEVYDVFNEAITDKHIIDKMYFSLKRFDEIDNIPPEIIADLYPFKNSDYSYPIYKPYALLAINKDIEKLFFEEVEIIDNAIFFKPNDSSCLEESEVDKLDKRLKFVIAKLNNSMILSIGKENHRPDALGYKGWSNENKSIRIAVSDNDTIHSVFMDLKLNEALMMLNNHKIGSNTSVIDDLRLGVAHFRYSNFHQAYQIFEQAATNAWAAGQYIAYFIAKYNVRMMRYLLNQFEQNITEKQKKEIFKLMEEIDIDKLIFKMPFIGKQEYSLLKKIRGHELLHRTKSNVLQYLDHLHGTYNLFKRGGYSSGTDYLSMIEHEILKMANFYLVNPFIIDEFNDFSNVLRDAIKGYLISFAMPEEYSNKRKDLTYLFFWFFCHYGSKKQFEEICKNYDIKELTFETKDFDNCIVLTNNYLNSFFKETNTFGVKIKPNEDLLHIVSSNFFFADKCKKIFNNLFTLLSHTKISAESESNLIDNLINFLRIEKIAWGDSIAIITRFINRNHQLFSRDNFIALLEIVAKKTSLHYDSDFYRAIANGLKNNQYELISDEALIIAHIGRIEKKGNDAVSFVPLWQLCNDLLKDKVKNRIEEILKQDFNHSLYVVACAKNIIKPVEFLKAYVQWVNNEKREHLHPHDGLFSQTNYTFLNFAHFIYRHNLDENPELNGLTDLAEYQKFFLTPEKYDYSKFEIEWILQDFRDSFFKRFCKIPEIKSAIEVYLKEKWDEKLAKVYLKHFVQEPSIA